MAKALLIIDMQEILLPLLWRGTEIADRIAALAASARARGVPVVAIQQTGPPGTEFDPERPGWRLSPRLGVEDTDLRVRKSATDSFFGTGLAETLRARGVDTVVITGAATDFCVDATARSALSHRFDVDLVRDAHSPVDTGDSTAGLTARQVVDHHNEILSGAIHPGGSLRLVRAADVFPPEAAPPDTFPPET